MASGDVLARWEASDGKPPTTAFASLVRRNNHLVAAFDAATDEALDFTSFLRGYTALGMTVRIAWTSDTAITGNVIWDGSFEAHADDAAAGDLDADSFAAVQSVTVAAPSAAGEVVYDEIAFTNGAQIDSIATGEWFRFRLNRDANNASDTMAGDAHLVAVEIRET